MKYYLIKMNMLFKIRDEIIIIVIDKKDKI